MSDRLKHMPARKLVERELDIMQALWRLGNGTVSEVQEVLLHERMALLTQRCAEITDGAPKVVHQAHQRAAVITATIAAQLPAELRPRQVSAAS
jgi:hypothetical protein